MKLSDLKPGDTVTRYVGGVPRQLTVSEVTEDKIICSRTIVRTWEFDRRTGMEIGDGLGYPQECAHLSSNLPRVDLLPLDLP